MKKVVNYLFAIPPDFEKAKQHGEAQQLKCSINSIDVVENKCICCDKVLPEYTRRLRLCESPSLLIEHGDGFPLLFQFLKFLAAMFTVKFILLGLFGFIVYFTKNNSSSASISDLINNGENETLITIYEVIELFSNIIIIIMISIYWIFQDRYVNTLDENTKTDADFAVMIINLPTSLLNNELRNSIEKTGVSESQIIYINKCYRFDHILKLKQQQLYWLQKYKYLEVYRTKFKNSKKKIEGVNTDQLYPPMKLLSLSPWIKYPTDIKIETKLTEINRELLDENNQNVQYCGVSIVCLKTEKDAQKLIEYYKVNKVKRYFKKYFAKFCKCFKYKFKDNDQFLIGDRRPYVFRAPEPGDIIWENLHIKSRRRWLVAALIYAVCLILLVPTFLFINYLYNIKRDFQKKDTSSGNTILVYIFQILLTCAIFVVNVLIEFYIDISTKYEKQTTYTSQELSVAFKMALLKFLNTCLIPLIGNTNEASWFENHGLVEEVFFVIIFLSIGEIIRVVFNIDFLFKFMLRTIEKWKGEKSEITQRQANILFENDETELCKTMSVILVFVFTLNFYSSIMPGLTIFGIIGCILVYWVLKIIFTRRKISKGNINSSLIVSSSSSLAIGVLANTIMGFIFLQKLTNRFSVPMLLSLIISILFFILPVRKVLCNLFSKSVERDDQSTYYDYYKKFYHYDVKNPVTKEQGIKRLEGKSLKSAIRKLILNKLLHRVSQVGVKKVEQIESRGFGISGLKMLLCSKVLSTVKDKHSQSPKTDTRRNEHRIESSNENEHMVNSPS